MTGGFGYRGSRGSSSNMVRDVLRTNELIVPKYPFLSEPTVHIGEDTLAVTLAVPEFPDILVAVGPGKGALTVTLAVAEFPDIPLAAGKCVGALTVRPTSDSHIGITRRQSALPIGWYGQKNEKVEGDAHQFSLTGSTFKQDRLYRLR